MTEKRFTFHHDVDGIDYIQDETNGFCFICDKLLCSLLNDLSTENSELKQIIAKDIIPRLMNGFEKSYKDLEKENKQLKKILNELSDMLQFDVENGIRSYPVKLSGYLSNALKELQE